MDWLVTGRLQDWLDRAGTTALPLKQRPNSAVSTESTGFNSLLALRPPIPKSRKLCNRYKGARRRPLFDPHWRGGSLGPLACLPCLPPDKKSTSSQYEILAVFLALNLIHWPGGATTFF